MSFASLLLAVAVVAHEPGYYTSLANHIKRWLQGEGVQSTVVTPAQMPAALQNEKVAFLVGFASPTKAELQTLRAFRAKGGKLVVFHSGSPSLGELMGVKPLGYTQAPYPGAWSKMVFSGGIPAGLPSSIRQTSTVLQRAMPIPGRGRVFATWADRNGKSTGEAAWIATSAGFWMTHVLLADGEEDQKARLLGAIVGAVDPKAWSVASHNARVAAKTASMREYAARQSARVGEIHATWDHSGCGLYPGNWPKTMGVLKNSGITDLFVNVAGAGFAHYKSGVLPRSRTLSQEGDQLAACLAAAAGTGIRVHAWILAFSATRGTPEVLENFRKKGWRLKLASGKLTEYLDPANAEVRAYMLSAISEIQAKYPVAGIHLDFVRWGEGTVRPKNAPEFVSRFVAEARQRTRRPKWLTAAVYGKYPACVGSVGQDWYGWLDTNLVDYVVPMDYTESKAKFLELLIQQAAKKTHARKTIVGIGVTANESRLDARQVMDQINMTRKFGFAGNALFDLDVTLEGQILPYLRLGIWKAPSGKGFPPSHGR